MEAEQALQLVRSQAPQETPERSQGGAMEDHEHLSELAVKAYIRASQAASKHLPPTDPLTIELAYKLSHVYLDHLNDPEKAWEAAYQPFSRAAERPADLCPAASMATQLLRDQLASINVPTEADTEEACGAPPHPCGEAQGSWGHARAKQISNQKLALLGRGSSQRLNAAAVAIAVQSLRRLEGTQATAMSSLEGARDLTSALERVFKTYVAGHSVAAVKRDADTVTLQGRSIPFEAFLLQGPFLNWTGFQLMCHDFGICPAAPGGDAGKEEACHEHSLICTEPGVRTSGGTPRE
ncbi:unnamed protein product [Chrysoparadoxa australica]